MKYKTEQLFEAVSRSQTGNIQTILSQGVNVNARAKKTGSTPLILAAKKRNYVVQKILLSNGANPKIKDYLGLMPIHYTAEAGDMESMKLLLAYQSPIDIKDEMGCTPLHYATDRGHDQLAELLVFCGADGFTKSMTGQSPMSVARQSNLKKILLKSQETRNGIKNGGIYIQHVELQARKVYRLDAVDISIYTPETFPVKDLSFLCRRVKPEYSSHHLRAVGRKEILISDTFEYIISSTHLSAMVGMEIPLYDQPAPYENIYMKTDMNTMIDPTKIIKNIRRVRDENSPGRLKWVCYVEVDITRMRSFILIAIPRVEEFSVGEDGGTFTSDVDKFIEIQVQPETFESGHISLEVIPSPVYKPDLFPEILSIGHFYDLNHSEGIDEFSTDHVSLTAPLPHDYEGEGRLCFISARIPGLDIDEYDGDNNEHWEIISENVPSKKGRVSCSLSHFSIHVVCETKKDVTDEIVFDQTRELLQKAFRRDRFVKFFTMLRPLDRGIYSAVLECTIPQKIKERMDYWKTRNYFEQSFAFTGDFETYDHLCYEIDICGNIDKMSGMHTLKLQFHTKRQNFQHVHLVQKDCQKPGIGSFEISEDKDHFITSVPIYLMECSLDNQDTTSDDDTGFTSNKFLREIATNLGPDWVHVAILLGLSVETVDEFRRKPTSIKYTVEQKCLETLQFWRNKCKSRTDKGVPDLVISLQRVGRTDIAESVLDQMHCWLQKKKNESDLDDFDRWIEDTVCWDEGVSKMKEKDFQPMSDAFLVLLAEIHGSPDFQNVGITMGLANNQIQNIFTDFTLSSLTQKVFMMLVRARQAAKDEITALSNLLSALDAEGCTEAKEWAIERSREWLEKTSDTKSKFHTDLKRYIENQDGKANSNEEDDYTSPNISESETTMVNTNDEEMGKRISDMNINQDSISMQSTSTTLKRDGSGNDGEKTDEKVQNTEENVEVKQTQNDISIHTYKTKTSEIEKKSEMTGTDIADFNTTTQASFNTIDTDLDRPMSQKDQSRDTDNSYNQ